MNLYRKKLFTFLLLSITLCMSGCQLQEVIEEGVLKNWFWSRFGWSALISAVLGVIAAKVLCRLPIKAPLLDCIVAARIRLAWWTVVLALILTPLLLWGDAVITQPFGEGNVLGAWKVFFLVVLDWHMLALMACVALVFCLAVAVFTRYVFARTCNCKYVLIPKLGS